MSGTHRDLLFDSKGRCFECKNHRWGLGPIDTSNSDARHGVLHAENHRWVLGTIETCNFGPKVAGLHAKTTDEVWAPYKLVSLVRNSLFCMKKTQMRAGIHIDLSFWCKSRCFACTKRKVMSGTLRDLLFWSISRCFASKNHRWGLEPIEPSANHAVVHAQNERSCLGPLETCYSGPEFAVLHAKTTGGVLDPQALVILMLGTLFCMQKTTGEVWDP